MFTPHQQLERDLKPEERIVRPAQSEDCGANRTRAALELFTVAHEGVGRERVSQSENAALDARVAERCQLHASVRDILSVREWQVVFERDRSRIIGWGRFAKRPLARVLQWDSGLGHSKLTPDILKRQ